MFRTSPHLYTSAGYSRGLRILFFFDVILEHSLPTAHDFFRHACNTKKNPETQFYILRKRFIHI